MKRFLLAICCLVLCCSSVSAGGKGERKPLRWGVDWGYGLDVFKYWSLNYRDSQVGYRVFDEDYRFEARPNAYFNASLGYEPVDWMEADFVTGIAGVDAGRNLITAGLQIRLLPEGNLVSGPVITAGGGLGAETDLSAVPASYFTLGGGWRFCLNAVWDIDFLLRARVFIDSPPVWDEEIKNYVPKSDIGRSLAVNCALEFGIALSF